MSTWRIAKDPMEGPCISAKTAALSILEPSRARQVVLRGNPHQLAKHAMKLRIAAEAGIQRRFQQVVPLLGEHQELFDAQAVTVVHQRYSDFVTKMLGQRAGGHARRSGQSARRQ